MSAKSVHQKRVRNRSCDVVSTPKVQRVEVSVGDTDIHSAAFGSYKESGEWKSKHTVRAPWAPVDMQTQDHKDPTLSRRMHESNFFVLVNTNRSPPAGIDTIAVTQALEHAVRELGKDRNLACMLVWGPKDPHYSGDSWDKHIKSVTYQAGVERGEKHNMIHAHLWITFQHYSQIQLHGTSMALFVKDAFNTYLREKFGGTNNEITGDSVPYVQIKLMPQSDFADVIKSYMSKTA